MQIRRRIRESLIDPILRRGLVAEMEGFSLSAGSEAIPLSAVLRCKGNLQLELCDPQGRDISKFFPQAGVGVFGRGQTLTGTGIVAGDVRVRLTGIRPPNSSTARPIGVDRSSSALVSFEGIEVLCDEEVVDLEDRGEQEFEHLALFAGTNLKYCNYYSSGEGQHDFWNEARDDTLECWDGEVLGGRFSLIQDEDCLKVGFRHLVANEEIAKSKANAVFQAVGYSHAFSPWPFYSRIQENGQIIEEVVKPVWPHQGSFFPLWKRHAIEHRDCPTRLISAVASWLVQMGGELRSEIEHALWIFRSADHDAAPPPLQMAMIGSVIEGLLDSCDRPDPPESFLQLKDEAIQWANGIATTDEDSTRAGFADRLVGYLSQWNYQSRRERWLDSFLPLFPGREQWVLDLFSLFQQYRNPPSHGNFAATMGDPQELLRARGRLAGFVNIIIAARAGYEGPILESPHANPVINLVSPST